MTIDDAINEVMPQITKLWEQFNLVGRELFLRDLINQIEILYWERPDTEQAETA